MARLQLNKSSLASETRQLEIFQRFLPALDLKRQQLMAERAKAKAALAATEAQIHELKMRVRDQLTMLANEDVELNKFFRLREVHLDEENVVGTRLPVLAGLKIEARPYAKLAKPHWVDRVAEVLHEVIALRVRAQVETRRLSLLEHAVKIVTQRVNLFDKVLIPRTRENIKRIRIYLSDAEMAGVVRSKLAKRKHLQATTS